MKEQLRSNGRRMIGNYTRDYRPAQRTAQRVIAEILGMGPNGRLDAPFDESPPAIKADKTGAEPCGGLLQQWLVDGLARADRNGIDILKAEFLKSESR